MFYEVYIYIELYNTVLDRTSAIVEWEAVEYIDWENIGLGESILLNR